MSENIENLAPALRRATVADMVTVHSEQVVLQSVRALENVYGGKPVLKGLNFHDFHKQNPSPSTISTYTHLKMEWDISGTVEAEIVPWTTPCKQFYQLPLKQKNQIVVSVRASFDAEILLFDGDRSSSASDVKVQILLGGDHNSMASIELQNDDRSGRYAKEFVKKDKLLSYSHMKVFTIRWYYGRVMVYHHVFKKPFIIWDGPKDAAFNHVGVRTCNCPGQWRVQNEAAFTTVESAEYKEIQINSGRLDFEVSGYQNCFMHFLEEPTWTTDPLLTAVLCWGGDNKCSGFWSNQAIDDDSRMIESEATLAQGQYRRFYIEWDAMNMTIGRPDPDRPFAWRRNKVTHVKPIKYVALQGHVQQSHMYFHLLNTTRPEDTVVRKAGDQISGNGVDIIT